MMWKHHWDVYVVSKWPFLFCKFFKNLSSFLCHFVIYSIEYYEWFWRLKHHTQVSTWVGLVAQSVILGSMWPTGQSSNNSVINRWWRFRLPSDPRLALRHPNSWLESQFILLAKIIEYAVFQRSLSLVCVHWNF